jgi:acetoin utilization deacetylase AcuC-like enzyme
MKAFYCDHFVLPLPENHRFPMPKYALLREQILDTGTVPPANLIVPDGATDEQILRVHSAEYWNKARTGGLSDKEIRRMGFPWSKALVERSRRSVGGTISACRAALSEGIAVNLAGGTHHAFPDYGAGFCVLNDAAIAARTMQTEAGIGQVVILDGDVHQGDGTAAIFADDPTVFTFSVHGARNFPFRKQQSDLDIELEDETGDESYLAAIKTGAEYALDLADAELAIYLAGADPFEGDRLGRLKVSKSGLAERDRYLLAACCAREIPVAVVMAGGYARAVQDIVDIHLQTVQIAAEMAGSHQKVESRVWGNATL